jgi:molybdopterin molybdotransferase
MISARAALELILGKTAPCGTITRTIESAAGYALAEDIQTDIPVPRFDNYAMDGYAIRVEDITAVPVTLHITGEIAAGDIPPRPLGAKEAMAIMTGAPLPECATAVIQQEWTERSSPQEVKVLKTVPAGHNCRRVGSDIAAGSIVFHAGTVLRAQETGVLASLGVRFVNLFRKPRIGLLATGSELVDYGKTPGPGKLRDSNSPALSAKLRELGCEVISLGIVPDEREAIVSALRSARNVDCLITTGGVSVGTHDLVRSVLVDDGIDILFWKVNIKPGMPMLFGVRDDLLVFGLPGNTVSSLVTFLQFVQPAIQKMSGHTTPVPAFRLPAILDEGITKQDGKRYYVRGVLERRGETFHVRSTGSQVSNILMSLVKANCLIVLPEDKSEFTVGSHVEVELLP